MSESSEVRTHLGIDPRWSGRVLRVAPGACEVELVLLDEMAADASGLVHGGFVFSAADHCAMCTVNHPNVVLARSELRFLRPSRVGTTLRFAGRIVEPSDRRPVVHVEASDAQGIVFEGQFHCAIPARHVLSATLPAGSDGVGP